jgi:hyperosmotically inducible protein
MRFLSLALAFALILTPLMAQKQVADGIVTDQVRLKLANDSDVGGMPINVEVSQGVVTLSGKVRTEKQRSKAEKLTKKVKGVVSVTNKIVVSQD